MKRLGTEQVLCRFQLSNFIRHGMAPLYEWIVETAHREGLQGATVLKGFFGLRPEGSVLELSTDLPIVIEIVDSEEKVDTFLPTVDELVTEGLVTLEAVRIVRYVSPESR